MDQDAAQRYLRLPAYGLYHVGTLEQSASGDFMYDMIPHFLSYPPDLRRNIREALIWAKTAETIDWEAVLPSLPHSDSFKRAHLSNVLERLQARYGDM